MFDRIKGFAEIHSKKSYCFTIWIVKVTTYCVELLIKHPYNCFSFYMQTVLGLDYSPKRHQPCCDILPSRTL